MKTECDRSDGASCFALGKQWLEGRGGPRELSAARRYVQRACDRDHAKACNNLGLLLRDGNGGQKDEKKAASVFEKACTLQNGQSCAHFASILLSNDNQQKRVAARQALKIGCRLGNETACYTYGVMTEKGAGGEADLGLAWWAMQRGCNKGHEQSCMHMKTLSVIDPRSVIENACKDSDPDACLLVATMADSGYYGSRDQALSRKRYAKACMLGIFEACNSAGEMWAKGEGGEQNIARAKWYFRLACKGDEPMGCANLALFAEWDGDLKKARHVRTLACDRGNASSCARLAWFWSWGWGGNRDPQKALTLKKKACRLGHEAACPARRGGR